MEVQVKTLTILDWAPQEASVQVPKPRLQTRLQNPTRFVMLAEISQSFLTSSSKMQQHRVIDAPVTLHRYPSFSWKKTGYLGSSFCLSTSQPIIPGTVLPVLLFGGRYHLFTLGKWRTVYPPHRSKLEVPSFTQKVWKCYYLRKS